MSLLRSEEEKQFLTKYSSFNSVENVFSEVVEKLIKNERLKRLLYYTDPRALSLPKLNPAQSLELIGKQIKIIPKLEIETDAKPYIILTMDNFVPNEDISAFRSATLGVDIICHYDHWGLQDFKLRPYSIAGEIDAMLNRSSLTRLGDLKFAGAKMLIVSPEIGGLSLYYSVESQKDDLRFNPNE